MYELFLEMPRMEILVNFGWRKDALLQPLAGTNGFWLPTTGAGQRRLISFGADSAPPDFALPRVDFEIFWLTREAVP